MPANLDDLLLRLGSRARLVRHADLPGKIDSARQFAEAVGCRAERVAKTLILCAQRQRAPVAAPYPLHAAVVLAVTDVADLDVVAASLSGHRPRLASRGELRHLLGTLPGAVSPFWTGAIPVYVDVKLLALDTVFVGGGERGIDIEIAPRDLVEATNATVGPYSRSFAEHAANVGGLRRQMPT